MCSVAQEKIIELLGIDRVTIIRGGNVPQSPAVPNVSLNIIKSAIIAILIFAAAVLAMVMFNDKINGPEDVEKYLGISVLGNIPYQNRNKAKR